MRNWQAYVRERLGVLARVLVATPRPSSRLLEAHRVERPGLRTEIRFALRALVATPGFTVVVVLTLALGVGVTTAMFSLVDRVVLAPLPFANPEELVLVQQVVPPIKERFPVVGASLRSIAAWQDGCRVTCGPIATLEGMNGTLAVGGEPQGVIGARVSANLLDVLGMRPLLGRGIQTSDSVEGSDRVLLLSFDLWQQWFGGDSGVIGRTVKLDSVEREIIGVLPQHPRLPRLDELTPMRRWEGHAQVLVPFVASPNQQQSGGDFSYVAIFRLRAGATAAQAREELTPITHAAFSDVPFRPDVLVRRLGDYVIETARRPLWALLGAVFAMLAVACLNVANLVAGRWLARRRELAIRLSLGARPADLLRHVGAEAVCLAALGGVGAITVAYATLNIVVARAPIDIPRLEEVAVDGRALALGLFITLVCTLLSCLLPVRRVIQAPPREMLDAGAHRVSEPRAGRRLRRGLVGVEVAASVMLLVVAGLLLASFVRVNSIDRGFVTEGRVAVDLNLSRARYAERAARTQLIDEVLKGVNAIAGVDVAAVAQKLPLEGEASVDLFMVPGAKQFEGSQPVGSHLFVSPGYFRALELPVLAGRTFTDADRERRVAVVSATTARALWPHATAVGQRFSRTRPENAWEVIGVVADTYTETLERQPGLMAYIPHWEHGGLELSVVIRTFGRPERIFPSVRHAIENVDPELAMLKPRTMNQVVQRATATRRFQVSLTMAFAIAGLVLACLGIYGVVSAAVVRRRGELGVRRAVGAGASDIARTVLVEALTPVVAGLAFGAAATAALGSVVATLLFDISPHDPVVFSTVAGLILICALAACAAPLVRALRTSPMVALRGG